MRLMKKVQLAIGEHGSLGNSDLSHVTSVGEVVIRRAHDRRLDSKTRWIAGSYALWGEVGLCIYVTTLLKVKM